MQWHPIHSTWHEITISVTYFLHSAYFPCASKRYREIRQNVFLLHQPGKSRLWYPILLSVMSHQPLLITSAPILLQLPGMNKIQAFSTQYSFRLAAWKISGKDYKVKDFLRRCPTFSSPHGEKALQGNMRVLGDCGVDWCDFWQINCFSMSVKNILT